MDIDHFIAQFESGTLPYKAWTHHAHLRVALYYIVTEDDFFTALAKVRCGIIRYNKAAELQKEAESRPDLIAKHCSEAYHETITRFWMNQIKAFVDAHPDMLFEELEEKLFASNLGYGRYILQYYNPAEIKSSRYRAEYIPFQTSGL